MQHFPGNLPKLQLNILRHSISRFIIAYNLEAKFSYKPFMSNLSLTSGGSRSLRGLSVIQNKNASTWTPLRMDLSQCVETSRKR